MNNVHVPFTDSIVFAAEYLNKVSKEYVRKMIREKNFPIGCEEHIVLDTVYFNPGCIQMEIAKKLFMQRSYLCKILTKLEEDGYIRREQKIKGKRQVVMAVYLTEKGEEIYKKMHVILRDEVLSKQAVDIDKIHEITDELFKLGDDLVKNFNLKL